MSMLLHCLPKKKKKTRQSDPRGVCRKSDVWTEKEISKSVQNVRKAQLNANDRR